MTDEFLMTVYTCKVNEGAYWCDFKIERKLETVAD